MVEEFYEKKSNYENTTFYFYYEKKCKSRVFLKDNVLSKYSEFISHNHGVENLYMKSYGLRAKSS